MSTQNIRGNAGIVVTGGTLNADVIAVGYRARAEKTVGAASAELNRKGMADVQAKLDTLMSVLKQRADGLADPQQVFGLVERVAGELTQKQPDKLTLKGFLTALVEETKSVAEIAGAVLSLKDLVAGLF